MTDRETSGQFSWPVVVVYLTCLLVVSIVAFSSNYACLFFDWDGVAWYVVADYLRDLVRPWQGAFDPVQGLFDFTYLAYRPGLPLDWLKYAVPGLQIGKTTINVFYAMFLSVSVLLLALSAKLTRSVALVSAVLASALMLPFFSDTPALSPIFALNPNYLYLVSTTTLMTALFWRIPGSPWPTALLLTFAIFVLLSIACNAMVFHTTYMLQVLIPLWTVRCILTGSWGETLKALACIGILFLAAAAAGLIQYLYALAAR